MTLIAVLPISKSCSPGSRYPITRSLGAWPILTLQHLQDILARGVHHQDHRHDGIAELDAAHAMADEADRGGAPGPVTE